MYVLLTLSFLTIAIMFFLPCWYSQPSPKSDEGFGFLDGGTFVLRWPHIEKVWLGIVHCGASLLHTHLFCGHCPSVCTAPVLSGLHSSLPFALPFSNVLGSVEFAALLLKHTDFKAAITDNWTPVLLTSKTVNTPRPTQQFDPFVPS